MNIQFRSRSGEAINYNSLLNYGICCKGITLVGTTGEYNHSSCFATGGVFIPYTISDDEVLKTSNYTPRTICPNPFLET